MRVPEDCGRLPPLPVFSASNSDIVVGSAGDRHVGADPCIQNGETGCFTDTADEPFGLVPGSTTTSCRPSAAVGAARAFGPGRQQRGGIDIELAPVELLTSISASRRVTGVGSGVSAQRPSSDLPRSLRPESRRALAAWRLSARQLATRKAKAMPSRPPATAASPAVSCRRNHNPARMQSALMRVLGAKLWRGARELCVMAGLDGIRRAYSALAAQTVDARVKPGHDELRSLS